MALHHPDAGVREAKELEFHEAMNSAAQFLRHSKLGTIMTKKLAHMKPFQGDDQFNRDNDGLYKAFKRLGRVWHQARQNAMRAASYAERMKKSMQMEQSYSDDLRLAKSETFLEAYAKVLVETQKHRPMGNSHNDVWQLTGIKPKGLDIGQSDDSRKALVQPQLDDHQGVEWSKFFFDPYNSYETNSVEDDMELMATLWNYLGQRLGFDTTEEE
jgi:hypothetical protein